MGYPMFLEKREFIIRLTLSYYSYSEFMFLGEKAIGYIGLLARWVQCYQLVIYVNSNIKYN